MTFTPTPEKLIPDLSPREELVLLARRRLGAEALSVHVREVVGYAVRHGADR